MMVVFGGRTADGAALNDTFGFRRHRDGTWDWARAPYRNSTEAPKQRYQVNIIIIILSNSFFFLFK